MTDVAAQLLAALDRAEETAQEATPGPWRTYDDPTKGFSTGCDAGVTSTSRDVENPPVVLYEGQVVTEDAAHIAANDPAHVLRLCAALREVVKLHASEHVCPSGNGVGCTDYGGDEDWQHPCPTLRALASVWDVPGGGGMSEREELAWGDMPYDGKTPREVVDDYVLVRGDLVAEYARAQLASWIERYAAAQVAEALAPVLALADEWERTYDLPALDPHPLTLRHAERLRVAAGTPTHHTTEEDTP